MNKIIFYIKFYAIPVLSGVLLSLIFPKTEFYLLAWISLSPLLVWLYKKDQKESFISGLICGIFYFLGSIYWIYYSVHHYGHISFAFSLIIVFLLGLYMSLYLAIFCWLYTFFINKTDSPAVFIAPILWTSLEFIRTYLFTGFPWSSLGYSQYKFLHFIQISDITGIYGISFFIVAVNGAIADISLFKKKKKEKPLYSPLPSIIGAFILVISLISIFSYGFHRLNQVRTNNEIKVAVIQGNIDQSKKWDKAFQDQVLTTYKDLTVQSLSHNPQFIVWPEASLPFIFGKDKEYTNNFLDFQRQTNAYLLFGGILVKDEKKSKYTNSAVLLNQSGTIAYIYDKIHLVPFGEYMPLNQILFFINKLTVDIGNYVPGITPARVVTPFGSFGAHICYEIIFPELVRKFYVTGGDFIVTITNDAWFGKTAGPYQHFSMAVFRAIENRKPVIRSANTGISGFIDSSGRIGNTTELFTTTYLIERVKTDKTLSFYTKFGDLFSYFCIIISVILILNNFKSLMFRNWR